MSAPAPWHLSGSAAIFFVPVPGHRLASTLVMLVHYRHSPVGPYEELLWCRQRRIGGSRAWTVDPIVVDSSASVEAGRHNWGFPKELAGFSVAEHGGRVAAAVYDGGGRVFADIAYRPTGPALPVSSSPVPGSLTELIQERDGRRFRVRPRARGRLRRLRVERFDLGPPFPRVIKTDLRMAVGLGDFEVDFPAATIEAR